MGSLIVEMVNQSLGSFSAERSHVILTYLCPATFQHTPKAAESPAEEAL